MPHPPPRPALNLLGLDIPNHRRRLLRLALGLTGGVPSELPPELLALQAAAPRRAYAERLLVQALLQAPQLVARRLFLVSAYPTEPEVHAILTLTIQSCDDRNNYVRWFLEVVEGVGLDRPACFVLWELAARAWEIQGALVPGALFGMERLLMGVPRYDLQANIEEVAR